MLISVRGENEHQLSFEQEKQRSNQSAEIFAAFTLSKIDKTVLDTMTPEQIAAVKEALLAGTSEQRHAVDVRITLPLWYRRFYMVLLMGRDRRLATLITERARQAGTDRFMGLSVMGLVAAIAAGLLAIGAFFTAYWIKSEMGIDLFPDRHLGDFLSDWTN